MFSIKQTKPVRRAAGETGRRPANLRYVYLLTAFVSIGALLFGYGKLRDTINASNQIEPGQAR